jgi:hypothetical protein
MYFICNYNSKETLIPQKYLDAEIKNIVYGKVEFKGKEKTGEAKYQGRGSSFHCTGARKLLRSNIKVGMFPSHAGARCTIEPPAGPVCPTGQKSVNGPVCHFV